MTDSGATTETLFSSLVFSAADCKCRGAETPPGGRKKRKIPRHQFHVTEPIMPAAIRFHRTGGPEVLCHEEVEIGAPAPGTTCQ